jgi:hypothetical protein
VRAKQDRIWRKSALTGYNLDLAFLKEGEGQPKIKKWVMEFHEKRSNYLIQALNTLRY